MKQAVELPPPLWRQLDVVQLLSVNYGYGHHARVLALAEHLEQDLRIGRDVDRLSGSRASSDRIVGVYHAGACERFRLVAPGDGR